MFSVLIPILTPEWRLSAGQAGLILGGFQLGSLVAYVIVGILLDRVRSKPIMAVSAALVGFGDLLFAVGARDFASGFLLRVLVGILIGGLYLPALKVIADTTPAARRGTATGIYMATIVVAHAAPLFYIGVLAPLFGWRATIAGIGILELLGALIIVLKVPNISLPPVVSPSRLASYVRDVLRNPPARRVIVAYTGHNWELFGLWGWLAPFMVASLGAHGAARADALARGGLLAAVAIGVGGAIGAVTGGRLSDRAGRTRAATAMLTASLCCALVFGWLYSAPVAVAASVALLYGIVSLADSPSYSATLMEVVPTRSLGGAFAAQMLFGWAATAAAPAAFGVILDLAKGAGAAPPAQWGTAFWLLALGPIAGIVALRRRAAAGVGEKAVAGRTTSART